MSDKFFSFAKPRAARVGAAQVHINSMKVGETYTHNHTGYRTPFSVWVAQVRQRMGLDLTYTKLSESHFSIRMNGKRHVSAVM